MKKLLSPNNLILLTIFCIPLYLVRISIFGLLTNVLELLAIFTAFIFVIKKRNLFINKLQTIPALLFAGVFLIIFGTLFSTLLGDNYRSGFGILKSWVVIPLLFSYILYVNSASKEFAEKIFLTIFLSSSLVGLIGIGYKISDTVTYDGRLDAFYLSPNHLAMYLAPGIFFGTYFVIKSYMQEKFSKLFLFHSLLVTTIFISLYYTYSYAAWLAVLVSVLVISFFFFPLKKNFFMGIFITLITVAFAFQINTPKFLSLAQLSERSSFASRIMIWKASFLMIKQHPVFGVGPGNFQSSYLSLQKHFPPYLEWAVPQPHNIFLAFWIQSGVWGLMGFLVLLYFVFQKLFLFLKNKRDAFFAAPLFGFFLYIVLHGLVDTTYWKNDLSFLFWMCVFLTLSLTEKSKSDSV